MRHLKTSVGEGTWPVIKGTEYLAGLVSTKERNWLVEDWTHLPPDTSQVYPLGQQWSPSVQQVAFSKGQQPTPWAVRQHVVVPGHWEPSLHTVEVQMLIIARIVIAMMSFDILIIKFM